MSVPAQRSFEELGTPLHEVTFCVLDLETTGGSARDCAVTEVGAVKVRGGEVVGTFQTLVDPGAEIPPSIVLLTGITQSMVIDAPRIPEVLPTFAEFVGSAVIVGHNVRFDLSFLDTAADRLGYPRFSANRWVDTAALARRLVRSEVRNLRLASLAAHFRSPVAPNHRALDDATATMHVFHSLLERAGGLGVTALEDLLALPKARGASEYRKIHLARDLPREPGVYLFRDRTGDVIYVGKAGNLRTRVSAYFYGDPRRTVATMLKELADVDHRVCAGELEASITELRLIHAHRPRHNRRSKPPRATHWLTLTGGDYPRLSVTRTVHRDATLTLGPFRRRAAAELVMAALWDATPVRRCTGRPGSRTARCAPAQLGVAECPCDGNLTAERYRAIVDRMVHAVDREPALLLDPLVERIAGLSHEQRYEEAAWVRDRHRALARALEKRRTWRALTAAGRIEAHRDGERAVIDRGRLVAAWNGADVPLLAPPLAESAEPVAPSILAQEEADLAWSWLGSDGTMLDDVTGSLTSPAGRVARLDRLDEAVVRLPGAGVSPWAVPASSPR
ncbi:MAG TPA: DEDD exonuclease domain-containing protein [Acidimicrobiia bacterium]|nr:DEDD exonuclease domain-containing protein [Acidimicrobiia bacterium]